MALASKDLPHPGGPCRRKPLGGDTPSWLYTSGCLMWISSWQTSCGVTQLLTDLIPFESTCLETVVDAANIFEGHSRLLDVRGNLLFLGRGRFLASLHFFVVWYFALLQGAFWAWMVLKNNEFNQGVLDDIRMVWTCRSGGGCAERCKGAFFTTLILTSGNLEAHDGNWIESSSELVMSINSCSRLLRKLSIFLTSKL